MALAMTQQQWISKTTRFGVSRTNSLITDLDKLLGLYWGTNDPGRQAKLLILIRYFCRQYLWSRGKTFRRKYVLELLDDATNELGTQQMQTAMEERAAGKRKGMQLPGKALDNRLDEYKVEMLQPRVKDSYHLDTDLTILRMPASEITQIMQRGNKLTWLDAIQDRQQQNQIATSVEYLDKTERLNYVLRYLNGQWYHGVGNQAPYSSDANHHDFWVEDMGNTFYLKRVDGNFQGGSFHHSSFLSGKPVRCGGTIQIRNGHLRHLSNESGHYRPRTAELLGTVQDLRNMGVALFFPVEDLSTGWHWYRASSFLQAAGVHGQQPDRAAKLIGT